MATRKGTKRQTMIYTTTKNKDCATLLQLKHGLNSCAPKEYTVPVPLDTPSC